MSELALQEITRKPENPSPHFVLPDIKNGPFSKFFPASFSISTIIQCSSYPSSFKTLYIIQFCKIFVKISSKEINDFFPEFLLAIRTSRFPVWECNSLLSPP